MSTHIQTCKPSTGWDWLVTGLMLFKAKPAEMFFLGNTYLMVILFPSLLIDLLGAVIVAVLTPGLNGGMMIAGRMATRGQRVTPKTLFAGFFDDGKQYAQRLLILGGAYAVCFAIIKLITHLILGDPPPIPESGFDLNNPQSSAQMAEYLLLNGLLVAVLSIPVVLSFWFAPALVIWHKMPAAKALFASAVAVWRNKSTFLIFGMGWLILMIGAVSVITFLLGALGLPESLIGIVHILTISLVMSVSICTLYPTYRSVLEHDPGQNVDVIV